MPAANPHEDLTTAHAAATQDTSSGPPARTEPSPPAQRHAMIAERAYFLAEARAFAPGGELDDWLAAEREIDRLLSASS